MKRLLTPRRVLFSVVIGFLLTAATSLWSPVKNGSNPAAPTKVSGWPISYVETDYYCNRDDCVGGSDFSPVRFLADWILWLLVGLFLAGLVTHGKKHP